MIDRRRGRLQPALAPGGLKPAPPQAWRLAMLAVLVALCGCASPPTPEQRTVRQFESLRQQPDALLAFLREMPKGGDLHNHLAGAIYAESLIGWAADEGLCVNKTTVALLPPPCDPKAGRVPASTALTDAALYRAMINGWSMRDWPASAAGGHDHFFETFNKFMPATSGRFGAMLAEVVSRAAEGHVSYLELMVTPDDGLASQIAARVGWDGDFAATRSKLEANGIASAAKKVRDVIRTGEAERDRLLECGTPKAAPGCAVTVRYLYQALRAIPLPALYAQLVTGFALANDPDSKVVGVNLVQAEDATAAVQNFAVHMQMLKFLRPLYPRAHLTLHAGELAPGLVSPDVLQRHIRDSIEIAGAERIGHGVDILSETNAPQLLAEMAQRHVMVEICLTSNDLILGARTIQHPLATYLQNGVPVALATDDEGVERSDMSREFLKAALDQHLGYVALKTLARTSLQYAFIDGGEKARLQADLDRAFAAFEAKY